MCDFPMSLEIFLLLNRAMISPIKGPSIPVIHTAVYRKYMVSTTVRSAACSGFSGLFCWINITILKINELKITKVPE